MKKWHLPGKPQRLGRRTIGGIKYSNTLCGRVVPLYMIGNPADDMEDDCKLCKRIEEKSNDSGKAVEVGRA
jgi:hypothetical protein